MTSVGDATIGAGGFTRFRELIRSLAEFGVRSTRSISATISQRVTRDDRLAHRRGSSVWMKTRSDSSRTSMGSEFRFGAPGVSRPRVGDRGRLMTQTDLAKAFDAINEESTRFYRISAESP